MNDSKTKKFGLITLVSISTIVIVAIFFLFVCGLNFNQTKNEPPISEKEDEEKRREEDEKRTLYYLEF